MADTLTTDRLVLRPLSPDDAGALFPIYHDPRAMRFMPSLPHTSPEETHAELSRDLGRSGACAWAIQFKQDNRPIGTVTFLGEVAVPGMGYLLHPDYWGQGIVPEAARAAVVYGFERLGYERIELWINEENAASIRVAQKLGFGLKGQIPLKYNHQTTHHIMLVFGRAVIEDDPAQRFFRVEPVLAVADIEKAATFYRDMLGFRIGFLYGSPPTHAGVVRGDWTGSGVTIQLTLAREGQSEAPSGSLHILVGTGLDALFETFRARGVTVVRPPVTQPWGMRDFAVRDLDGHLLVFATHA